MFLCQDASTTPQNKNKIYQRSIGQQDSWAEVCKVNQRVEDMFAEFGDRLANSEVKMEEVRKKSKASQSIEKKPRESDKSEASGRIEKCIQRRLCELQPSLNDEVFEER